MTPMFPKATESDKFGSFIVVLEGGNFNLSKRTIEDLHVKLIFRENGRQVEIVLTKRGTGDCSMLSNKSYNEIRQSIYCNLDRIPVQTSVGGLIADIENQINDLLGIHIQSLVPQSIAMPCQD